MFGTNISVETILLVTARVITFMLIIPIHESAHGLMAKWLGDDTAKKQGRISLNPFVHLDAFGFIMMLLLGFGWAKPVPVDVSKMKNKRLGYFLVSLAGPLSNIIAAFIGAAIYAVIIGVSLKNIDHINTSGNAITVIKAVGMLLQSFVVINVGLALFNLIPLPPLDGFNLLRAFMPAGFDRWVWNNYRYITGAFIILVLISSKVPQLSQPFSHLIYTVANWIWGLVMNMAGLIS